MRFEQTLIVSTIAIVTVMGACSGPLPEMPAVPVSAEQTVPPGVIAFIGADKQLWLMHPDGHNQQRLTTDGEAMSPAWSPDGQTLAYVYHEEGSKVQQAHLYNPLNRTDSLITVVSDPMLVLVNWSPNNRFLALDVGCCFERRLNIVEISGGQIVDELNVFNYAWSPNGDRLVFGLRTPLEAPISVEPGDSVSLAVIQVGQGQQPQVVFEGTHQALYFPLAWLHDGRVLYDQLDWDESTQTGDRALWTVTFNGERSEPKPAKNIPPAYNRDAVLARLPTEMQKPGTGSFSWSTDGRWVVFHAGEEAEKGIYLLDFCSTLTTEYPSS